MLRTLETVVLAPFLLTGYTRQTQSLPLTFYSQFYSDPASPVTRLDLHIQSHFAQVYRYTIAS